MSARKSEVPQSNPGRGATADVPAALVLGLLVWLLAIFVPLVSLGPDLPDALPALGYHPATVLALHRGPAPTPPPAYLDGYFAQLGRALDARDADATARAQRDFASFLVDAAGEDARTRTFAREHQLREFLRALDANGSAPMSGVARRHGLIGPETPPWVSRAMLIAWFDLRWEAAGARENLRGDPLALPALLARIPPEEARAHVAWALASGCGALLGLGPRARGNAPQQVRCSQVRDAYVSAASALDPGYPSDEARAAMRVLLARGLARDARRERDADRRNEDLAHARDAMDRAREDYTALLARTGSDDGDQRRISRYLLGTARALSED